MDNMQIEKFDKEKHYDEICEWFKRRGLKIPQPSLLSDNGVMVSDVAAGFLYVTDSDMAILDFYISNPQSSDKKRAKALTIITTNLIMWAKEMGFTHLITNSKINTIQKLAQDFDFKSYGFSEVFMKEL